MMSATRPGPADSATLHLSLFAISLFLFLSLPALMVRRYLLQRRFYEIKPLRGPERLSRLLGLGFVLLAFIFFILLAAAIGDMESFIAGEGASAISAVFTIPLLIVPWVLLLVAAAIMAVRQGWWSS